MHQPKTQTPPDGVPLWICTGLVQPPRCQVAPLAYVVLTALRCAAALPQKWPLQRRTGRISQYSILQFGVYVCSVCALVCTRSPPCTPVNVCANEENRVRRVVVRVAHRRRRCRRHTNRDSRLRRGRLSSSSPSVAVDASALRRPPMGKVCGRVGTEAPAPRIVRIDVIQLHTYAYMQTHTQTPHVRVGRVIVHMCKCVRVCVCVLTRREPAGESILT